MFISEISNAIIKNDAVVLVRIIASSGSVPRTSGSSMIVYKDGSITGTIGGGAVEGDVIKTSLELFETKNAVIKSYDLNVSGSSNSLDIVCGGQMQVLTEYVSSEKSEIFKMADILVQEGKSVLMVTDFSDLNDVRYSIKTPDTDWTGQSFPAQHEDMILKKNDSLIYAGESRYYVEQIKPRETIYLIGAGHVSKELAELCEKLDFRTVIIDDREEFANKERFPESGSVYVKEGFKGLFTDEKITANDYVVILTRGHQYDRESLEQALQTDAGYIGMIGSKKKRETVYAKMMSEGFTKDDLDRVHCPVGLPIGGDTPAEISVSIAAQLIQHRSFQK
ncbi:MAG: xanthine dehydrogenase [Denitrovibrio sp.]|nr:MAG: xanthine dehydrogenase [Denitrovibrio sp.]